MRLAARFGSGWGKWLRRLAVVLVAAEVAYVAAFALAAESGLLARWLDRRPEKVSLSYASARSWVPFHVSVAGLEVRGQTPRMRWRITADEARGWVSPLPLLGRRVRLAGTDARGVAVQLLREGPPGSAPDGPAGEPAGEMPAGEAKRTERTRWFPPIPPLAPLPSPPRPVRPKWSFEVPRATVADFRELWLDDLKLTGEIAAAGGFAQRAGREAEVFPSRVTLHDARLALADAPAAEGLAGSVELAAAPWPFKEERGWAVLPRLTGRAKLDGRLSAAGLLAHFGLERWVELERTPTPSTVLLELRAGELAPGSRVELAPAKLRMRILDFETSGRAAAELAVREDEDGPRADLALRFESFEIVPLGEKEPDITGSGLALTATTRDLLLQPRRRSGNARLDLGTARLADLARLDRLMPASLPLTLVAGSGGVTGGLEVDLGSLAARGRIGTRIDDAAVRYQNLDLTGDVALDLVLATPDLLTRTFDLAGTRIDLQDFESPQAVAAGPEGAPGWWARIELPEGEVRLPPEPSARTRFAVRLRDSVPLVGLFATRRDLPDWVESLLSIEDVAATGRLAWSPRGVRVDDLATRVREATLSGHLRFGRARRAGAMLVEWKKLALAAGFRGDEREIQLLGARDWYAERAARARRRE